MLLQRGFAESREQAQDLIAKGLVHAAGRKILKNSTLLPVGSEIKLVGEGTPYASRGGVKLQAALDAFGVDPRGFTAVDIGASTGGFTDCLLRKGVARVYAIDVGYGQIAWNLRQDPRVVLLERTNIRYLDPARVSPPADLITVDVSFISLKLVLPGALKILRPGGLILALVKPQFEVGKGKVGRGGIVKDRQQQEEVVREIIRYAEGLGLVALGTAPSPIPGRKGNLEFFVYFRYDAKPGGKPPKDGSQTTSLS